MSRYGILTVSCDGFDCGDGIRCSNGLGECTMLDTNLLHGDGCGVWLHRQFLARLLRVGTGRSTCLQLLMRVEAHRYQNACSSRNIDLPHVNHDPCLPPSTSLYPPSSSPHSQTLLCPTILGLKLKLESASRRSQSMSNSAVVSAFFAASASSPSSYIYGADIAPVSKRRWFASEHQLSSKVGSNLDPRYHLHPYYTWL